MRALPLALCALAATASADLWVDPPPSTPMDWDRDELHHPKGRRPAGKGHATPSPVGKSEEVSTGGSDATPKRKDGDAEPPHVPPRNRILSEDIFTHWLVKQHQPGWEDYEVVSSTPRPVLRGEEAGHPPVSRGTRERLLSQYFAHKEFPYYLPADEVAWYLIEVGWPAVEPSIGCLSDRTLDPLPSRVLEGISGRRFEAPAAWEQWFTARKGKAPRPAPAPACGSLEEFLGRWTAWELARGYWGVDEHFGERLRLYPELVTDGIRAATEEDHALIRQNAVAWLADQKDPELAGVLKKALLHKDRVTAFRAWRGLFHLGDPALADWTRKRLKSEDSLERTLAFYAAGTLPLPEAAGVLAEASGKPGIGTTALVALARLGDKTQTERLRTLAKGYRDLKEDGPRSDRGPRALRSLIAAAGLARLGSPEGGDLLIQAFEGQEAILEATGTVDAAYAFPKPEAIPQVQAFLIDLAGQNRVEAWQGFLQEMVRIPRRARELRTASVRNLSLGPGHPFLPELAKVAEADGDWLVRAWALARLFEADRALGARMARKALEGEGVPDPKALKALRALLMKKKEELGERYAEALAARAKKPEKVAELARRLRECQGEVRRIYGILADATRMGVRPELEEISQMIWEMRRRRDVPALAGILLGIQEIQDALGSDSFAEAQGLLEPLAEEASRAKTEEGIPELAPLCERLRKLATSPVWPDEYPPRSKALTLDPDENPTQVRFGAIAMEPLLHIGIEPVVEVALSIVRQTPAKGDPGLLLALASNPARSVQARLSALELLGGPEAVEARSKLIELAQSAKTPSLVRQGACLALGAQGGSAASFGILPLLEDPDGWVRFAAFAGLRRATGKELFCDWLAAPAKVRSETVASWRSELETRDWKEAKP